MCVNASHSLTLYPTPAQWGKKSVEKLQSKLEEVMGEIDQILLKASTAEAEAKKLKLEEKRLKHVREATWLRQARR